VTSERTIETVATGWERLADLAEQENILNAAVSAVRELGRLIAIEAQFHPQALPGKIPIE
jgi:hypothetical protein